MKIEADLILTCEENSSITDILSKLTLDTNDILIICPLLFLQRWFQNLSHDIDIEWFDKAERNIESGFVSLVMMYKNKMFNFSFIIIKQEETIINNPVKGEEVYRVGIKEIKIQ